MAATVASSRLRNSFASRLAKAVCAGVNPAACSFSRGRESLAKVFSSSASSQINPK